MDHVSSYQRAALGIQGCAAFASSFSHMSKYRKEARRLTGILVDAVHGRSIAKASAHEHQMRARSYWIVFAALALKLVDDR